MCVFLLLQVRSFTGMYSSPIRQSEHFYTIDRFPHADEPFPRVAFLEVSAASAVAWGSYAFFRRAEEGVALCLMLVDVVG